MSSTLNAYISGELGTPNESFIEKVIIFNLGDLILFIYKNWFH